MGLRENLSRLSPNEFLEKMQDMFQMYQESQDDYYSEGLKQDRQDFRNSDSKYNKGYLITNLSNIKETMSGITRFVERLYASLKNKKVDQAQAQSHMDELLKSISFPKEKTFTPSNLFEFLVLATTVFDRFSKYSIDSLVSKNLDKQR